MAVSDIHILQFDAHTDYAPITADLRYTNGHAFRSARATRTS